MRISTLFYTIRQGFKNILRNKWFSLASIMTTSACLFLFGVFFSILTNFQNIVRTAQEGVCVTIFFDQDTEVTRKEEIGRLLLARPEVKDIYYVSPEEAWESFSKDYFGEEYAAGFTENPLQYSDNFQIYMNDVSMQSALVTYVKSLDHVRKVNESAITANMLSGMNSLVSYVTMAIIALLLFVSIFLISNTVMIGISVRKEEISIMKYIGATDFFVRAPFVVEGVMIGLIGSLIPLAIIYELYNRVILYVTERFSMLESLMHFLDVKEVFATLAPISMGIGVGIGLLGSVVTVRRHLRV
ncbi:MAG: ABC transporter permease [Lachnospiraceae bacterium]|nr:ABC transporter permease [Lachnospiraceae bacterium]